ncbi:GIY-YIG nuclease family protein [Cellulophaga sp. F20128]|uniref:exonuclease domain-containing protein n=1 Tax=Cellulophaga sp. F20128 TaxID=2926413 RepID=UPI001FF64E7C|nr:exonuclease domain-containing protein [Cellulophaga sp. F20128]MCK0157171.1 GIY-YIG nuclease family protein [Cellulophaga sp. F20128]
MYVILDIETTGGKYNEEGITEIAIHRFDGHKVVDKFISLINPEKEIQPFVVKLTGINDKMLRTAPKFHEVAKRIVEITEDAVLVAHNAQFDYRILRTEFRRLGYNFERKTLCTVNLSKELIPDMESYSLGKLVRSLGIPVSDRHRANGDALATLQLFKLLLAKDSDKTIIKSVIKEGTMGELSTRQIDLVEQLPTETGVYYMHDKEGEIIFIGKSSNIKKRVNKHFTGTSNVARKLQKQTRRITFEKTGNELVALLKENEELVRTKPKYNGHPKKVLFSFGIFKKENKDGYLSLYIDKTKAAENTISTFSSIIAAKNFMASITSEFNLCGKVNAISQAKTNCGNYEDGKCLGACLRKEDQSTYNERVLAAIDKYSLHHKSILIKDKGREIGEYSAILIQKGEFKGYGFYNLNHQINNIHILETIITKMKGSQNANHLIETYLRKRKGLKITELD